MTPQEVWDYYGNSYKFMKITGMTDATLRNWMKQGFVPVGSQYRLERITNGDLKHDDKKQVPLKEEEVAYNELKRKLVKIMFSFTNKYGGPGSNLYPQCGFILVDVLRACLNEASLQIGRLKS